MEEEKKHLEEECKQSCFENDVKKKHIATKKLVSPKTIGIIASAAVAVVAIVIVIVIVIGGSDNNSSGGNMVNGNENNEATGNTNGDDNSASNNTSTVGKIDLFEYMNEPEIDGASGEATIYMSFDQEEFARALAGPEPSADNLEAWGQWLSSCDMYFQYIDTISITCSQTTNLVNGDVVYVNVSVPDTLKDKIKNATKAYTISGLIEIKYYNFFDNIDVIFEGISGEGRVKVERKTDSDIPEDCIFSITPQFNISNNDVITVSITNADDLKSEYYIVPEELSKSYTVSGLPEYATSISQLPLEDIEQFAKQFYEYKIESFQQDNYFTYENIEYEGTYFYILNDYGLEMDPSNKNIIEIVISYELYHWNGYVRDDTVNLFFTNILIDSNGVISLSYKDGVEELFISTEYYDITPIPATPVFE